MSGEITSLLQRAKNGDSEALEGVFEILYPRLKRMAAGKLGPRGSKATLTPTGLVHEAYLRFIGAEELDLENRAHFFSCAARAMRQIVVDEARRRSASKRGGELQKVTLVDSIHLPEVADSAQLLDLDRALDELVEINERGAKLIELRFFAGLSMEDAAEQLAISRRTAQREWRSARAYLHARMKEKPGP